MARNCPRCGALVTADRCLSCGYTPGEAARSGSGRAAAGSVDAVVSVEGGPTWQGAPPPWEERPKLGFFAALSRTWLSSVLRPVPFFRGLSSPGPIGRAVFYFAIVTAVGMFFWIYWNALEQIVGGGVDNALLQDQFGLTLSPEEQIVGLLVGSFALFVFLVFLAIAALFVSAAIIHLGFAVVGAGRRGFNGTFRAVAYSSGPVVFTVFPFFGQLVALVWGSVLLFIGVREVQRTSNGRATIGFLLPAVVLFLLFLFVAFIIILLASSADIGPVVQAGTDVGASLLG